MLLNCEKSRNVCGWSFVLQRHTQRWVRETCHTLPWKSGSRAKCYTLLTLSLFFFVVLCLMCLCYFADTPNNYCPFFIKQIIRQTASVATANLLYNIVTYSIVTYKYKLDWARLINRNKTGEFPFKFQNQNTKACNPLRGCRHSKPLICSLEADSPLKSTEIPQEWQRKVTQGSSVQLLVHTSTVTKWHHFISGESCHNSFVKFVVKHWSCSSGD